MSLFTSYFDRHSFHLGIYILAYFCDFSYIFVATSITLVVLHKIQLSKILCIVCAKTVIFNKLKTSSKTGFIYIRTDGQGISTFT